jgi:hypothetical protein
MILHAHVLGGALLLAAAGDGGAPPRSIISVDFEAIPAREVFVHLQQVLGVTIVGRWSDDRAGHGIDPGTPITLRAVERPAMEVIERVLDQCADEQPCSWQVRGGALEVGTKERLSVPGALERRAYPIRDLLFQAPWFDNAPSIDIATALAQAGSGGGGSSGGAGGAGGRGGGGGQGGGGGAGGAIIDEPGAPPERPDQARLFEGLVEVIVRSVEPDIWEDAGGPATITPFGDLLIVRAPGFVHRQLAGGRRTGRSW